MMAVRSAIATACVRVSASSFERMWRTWLFTVSWLMKSLAATSALDMPSASSWRISRPVPSACSRALGQERGISANRRTITIGHLLIARTMVWCGASFRIALGARLRPRAGRLRSAKAVNISTAVSGAVVISAGAASQSPGAGVWG